MEKSSGKVSGSNLGIVIYYLRKRKKMPFTFSKNGAEKVNKIWLKCKWSSILSKWKKTKSFTVLWTNSRDDSETKLSDSKFKFENHLNPREYY